MNKQQQVGLGGKRTAEILKHLEKAILDGRIPPGGRLDETEIAEQFEVSRTPVREALLKLAASGLIETGKRRGAIVARIPVERVVSMMEVLSELEGCAARLAAKRMSDAEKSKLQAVHQSSAEFVKSNDIARFDAANKQFHEMIYEGARNEYLAFQVRDLRRRLWVWVYQGYPFKRPGRLTVSFKDHSDVVNAIIASDGIAADQIMQQHIAVGANDLADLVATMARLNTESS